MMQNIHAQNSYVSVSGGHSTCSSSPAQSCVSPPPQHLEGLMRCLYGCPHAPQSPIHRCMAREMLNRPVQWRPGHQQGRCGCQLGWHWGRVPGCGCRHHARERSAVCGQGGPQTRQSCQQEECTQLLPLPRSIQPASVHVKMLIPGYHTGTECE